MMIIELEWYMALLILGGSLLLNMYLFRRLKQVSGGVRVDYTLKENILLGLLSLSTLLCVIWNVSWFDGFLKANNYSLYLRYALVVPGAVCCYLFCLEYTLKPWRRMKAYWVRVKKRQGIPLSWWETDPDSNNEED